MKTGSEGASTQSYAVGLGSSLPKRFSGAMTKPTSSTNTVLRHTKTYHWSGSATGTIERHFIWLNMSLHSTFQCRYTPCSTLPNINTKVDSSTEKDTTLGRVDPEIPGRVVHMSSLKA